MTPTANQKKLALGLILIGIGIRLMIWFQDRDLWLDEAMLGISLAQRDPAGLLQPLEYSQGAPMIFVFGSKLVTMLAGFSGMSLRAMPLLAGCLFLPVFWWVASRILPARGALVALFLAATSRALIYYSNEFKPYEIDALIALFAIGIGHAGVTRGWNTSRLAALVALGLIGPWLAWPTLFVFAGMTPVLMWYGWRGNAGNAPGGLKGVVRPAMAGLLCLASFATQYAIFMAHLNKDTHTFAYWRGRGALGPGFAIWDDPGWPFRVMSGLCWHPEGLAFWPPEYTGYLWWAPLMWVIGPLLVVSGLVWLFRHRRPVFCFTLLPMVAVMGAANFSKYPFGERLVLFLLPGLMLACGAAASLGIANDVAKARPPWMGKAGWVALAGVVFCGFFPLGMVLADLKYGQSREEIRDVLRPIRARAQAGEIASIWAYHYCKPAIVCHHRAKADELPDLASIHFGSPPLEESPAAMTMHFVEGALQADGKVWIVATHIYGDAPKVIETALRQHGNVLETLAPVDGKGTSLGAWAWLFEKNK